MRDSTGLRLAVLLSALAWGGSSALAQDALPSASTGRDPAADNGVNFAPGAVTAGTATPGTTLGSVPPVTGCTPLTPCAVPSPALDDLAALPPAQAAAPPAEKSAAAAQSRGPGRGRAGGRRGGRYGDFIKNRKPAANDQP